MVADDLIDRFVNEHRIIILFFRRDIIPAIDTYTNEIISIYSLVVV